MDIVNLLSNSDQRDGGANDCCVPMANSLRLASTNVQTLDTHVLSSEGPGSRPALPSAIVVMPSRTSLSLEELTVEAFYERFCMANPGQRRNPDWKTVLESYENYVLKNFGRDKLRNILAAYRGV